MNLNDRQLKVLIISHSYVVKENQKNISALDPYVQVRVVVPDEVDDAIHGALVIDDHSRVTSYPRLSLWGVQYFLKSKDLGVREFKPDIMHVEYDPWSAIFWQCWISKVLFSPNAKIICTVKNNTYRNYSGFIGAVKKGVAKFFIKKCDFFISINQGAHEIYSSIFNVDKSKISVMQHLGVDTDIFFPSHNRNNNSAFFNIGYCGRFDHNKGVLELIETVDNLVKEGRSLTLSLLGSGSLNDEIHKIKKPWLNINPRVKHHEVAKFMRNLDIFVLPSLISEEHEEHDAHVVLEAMACGVPIIGSSSGIIPELLNNGNGLVFDALDFTDLKLKIMYLIDSPDIVKKMQKTSLEQSHLNYTNSAIAKKKFEIYENIFKL